MNIDITRQRAQEFDIEPQGKDESDGDFRHRVSGAIRDQGHVIEAHEAYQGALYDESDQVMTGIFGAVAQTLYGDYGSHGSSQVGDDIAAGTVMQNPRDDDLGLLAVMAVLMGK